MENRFHFDLESNYSITKYITSRNTCVFSEEHVQLQTFHSHLNNPGVSSNNMWKNNINPMV